MTRGDESPGPDQLDHARPEAALLTVRLFWGMAVGSQIAFIVLIHKLWEFNRLPPPRPDAVRIVTLIAAGLFLSLIPAGYFARNQAYKRHWRGSVIAPGGYIIGNLLLIITCEIVAVVGLTAVMIGRSYWPGALPAAAAIAVLIINIPTGAPMRSESSTP